MHKSILTILCICCASLLTAQENRFVIKGSSKGGAVKYIKLTIFNQHQETFPVTFDENGNFEISGEIDGVYPAEFLSGDETFYIPFFLENGVTYQVELNRDNLGSSKISGGEAQKAYLEIEAIRAEKQKKLKALEEQLMPRFIEAVEKKEKATADDSLYMQSVMDRFDALELEYKNREWDLFKANSENPVVAFRLYGDMPELALPEIKARYELLSDRNKASFIGQKIVAELKKQEGLAIGNYAPDFTMKNLAGEDVSLYGVKAKVKILDFWASWCSPCRAENPHLKKIYDEFNPKGLEIIGVSLDMTKMTWTKAINADKLPWIHLSDLKGNKSPVMQIYNVQNIPFMLILDQENRIVAKNIRGEELYNKIAELLK